MRSIVLGCLSISTIKHAIGFEHEQSRTDRDKYVKIIWKNIIPGKEEYFEKYGAINITGFGQPYDYLSVMHYESKSFTKNGKDAIVPIKRKVYPVNSIECSMINMILF